MIISHVFNDEKIAKDDCNTSTCIISNRLGSFFILSKNSFSKFRGAFIRQDYEKEPIKTIENIGLVDKEIYEIQNRQTGIIRKYGSKEDNVDEKIYFSQSINGLKYSLSKKSRIFLDFDMRKVYDMRRFGLHYTVNSENNSIIVHFQKKTDSREDASQGIVEFDYYCAILPKSSGKNFENINLWHEVNYDYDVERKDFPTSRFLYRPIIIESKELIIGFGKTKEIALDNAEKIKSIKNRKENLIRLEKKDNLTISAAYSCAQSSLNSLICEDAKINRIYAGYPWFFQFWARDECISLEALIAQKRFHEVKDILFSYLDVINEKGRIPNRMPGSDLGSADGIGWFWKRFGDFLHLLKSIHVIEKYLSDDDICKIAGKLKDCIQSVENECAKDNMISNVAKETWMDTDINGIDTRSGIRIEIQALHLNMLHLMYDLSQDSTYIKKEDDLKKKVLTEFWKKPVLADGIGDITIRPNIFIAYYVYPDLLSENDWKDCFSYSLERLWLDWGGLATIDKKDPLFVADYSGSDNKSYHRGDSWFWVNNLAAICLLRNNKEVFQDKIKKIIQASSEEMLWHGAIGHHAEISSASHLCSKGCLSQAWSAAMFIELVSEIYKKE